MTEFDFDELDKAVASAMGGEGDSVVPENNIPVKVETPAVPMVQERPQPPAVRRSRGRFMDIAPRTPVRPVVPAPAEPDPTPATPPPAEDVSVATEIKEAPHASNFHATHDGDEDALPSTPFLPDAKEKVEKRPLNAGLPLEPITDDLLVADQKEDKTAEVVENTSSPAPEIPENTHEAPVVKEEIEPVPVANETQTVSPTATVADYVPPVANKSVPEVEPAVFPKVATEPANAALYDTSQYHKPIEAKKKSGKLGVVIWIGSLVVVGAAIGWAIYTFVLPMILG